MGQVGFGHKVLVIMHYHPVPTQHHSRTEIWAALIVLFVGNGLHHVMYPPASLDKIHNNRWRGFLADNKCLCLYITLWFLVKYEIAGNGITTVLWRQATHHSSVKQKLPLVVQLGILDINMNYIKICASVHEMYTSQSACNYKNIVVTCQVVVCSIRVGPITVRYSIRGWEEYQLCRCNGLISVCRA